MTPIQFYTFQTPNGHKAPIMLEETGLRCRVLGLAVPPRPHREATA